MQRILSLGPGIILCVLLGALVMTVAPFLQLPAMILALGVGLVLHKIAGAPKLVEGVTWSSRGMLYCAVALLGMRIELTDFSQISYVTPGLVILVMIITIALSVWLAKRVGETRNFGILMGAAVAICGVSAAAALCGTLKDCDGRARQLTLTVAGITLLSTIAMVLYPALAHVLDLSPEAAGVFLGGSIHNVSQAVGAGYAMSPEIGDIAVLIKLMRVALLMPIVVFVAILMKREHPTVPEKARLGLLTYFPPFLLVFIILAIASCLEFIPQPIKQAGHVASTSLLVISLVAIGMKTNIAELLRLGARPFMVMTITTGVMAGCLLVGTYLLGL